MDENLIQIVDDHDTPMGRASKEEAWKRGLKHRIIRIMVEDEQGRVLLQKRSSNVKLYPNLWDNSVGGHVDADEDYAAAAQRELQEELGLTNVELADLGPAVQTNKEVEGKILNRFNKFYKAKVKGSVQIHSDPYEVSEVAWFTLDELERLAREHPEQITDGIEMFMRKYITL